MGSGHPVYRHTGVVQVRASTDPGSWDLPPVLHASADQQTGRDWLVELWRREEIRSAVTVASPALARTIETELAGHSRGQHSLPRLLGTVSAYLRRWQRRATPFGLFAGVAATVPSDQPSPAGDAHRITARPDAGWLGGLIDELEHDRQVRTRLLVVTNNAAHVRGDQLVVPTHLSESAPDHASALDLSLRLTGPVRAALDAASEPILLASLQDKLAETFAHASSTTIETLLGELVAAKALLTNLRPPMTSPNPLAHVVETLQNAELEDLPAVTELATQLSMVHTALPHHTIADDAGRAALTETATRMRTLRPAETVLAVDATLDQPPTIPEQALAEAESAATALLRLTPHPFGTPAWREYHQRFLARYGAGARVPVREIIADSGLGFPAGWLGAARAHSPHMLTERDTTLLRLIQQVTAAGEREITLTEPLLEQLRVGDHERMIPPERVELAFQLHSPSPAALRHGRFQLWVTGAMHPGSMAGRFAPLLSEPDQHRLAQTYAPDDEHTLPAQLSFPPRREHNENITRVPQLTSHLIPLGEYHEQDHTVIPLDDLAVTADHRSMGLIRLSTGQRVRPWLPHALETQQHTPPLARFLAELPSACSGFYGLVDVGAAREMPMLPRLRYGRTVLSPAQWRLPRADLLTAEADTDSWDTALATWRHRWHIPAHVQLIERGDQRLPLDLDDPGDRALLRRRLQHSRSSHVLLRETGSPQDHAWSRRVCEFLTPLSASPPAHQPAPAPAAAVPSPSRAHLPGTGHVLRADMLVHPERATTVLTQHLPSLCHALAERTRRWWFTRHHQPHRPDSDQYLTLCFRLESGSHYAESAARLADWAAPLQQIGLLAEYTLAPYHPHGTYGTRPDTETAAEQLFTTDSETALSQLHWASTTGLPSQATAAVSMTDIAAHLAPTPEQGYRWLTHLLAHQPGKLDRELRDAALHLADRDPLEQLTTLTGGTELATAWRRRREAVLAYRDQQHHDHADPDTVLRSLLREHHLRAVGVDTGAERLTQRLARAVAQRRLALGDRRAP
ncbi:thiopeptide-type bacteriocin biosynthesis domain-containing protein [Actinopolyspora alba]|uniref:Thiopeptide-type bacteriocin biosynthesis domain-containing protein n=1 Tax=Actinopolyspora alba TaxID=673379 RepID=A0A1I2CHK0_9ACTN|nr:lantibiotic dehydratase [Actinopolyspora alba]SFE67786.1 thiopeptide-type bacteriocin biosynthesis domain-containing protein [Actinopolyspora alba]